MSDGVIRLMERAFEGDRKAENELAHRLCKLIGATVSRRLIARGMRRGLEKTDLVQIILKHLCENGWARLRKFNPAEPLEPWVATVTRRRIEDILRTKDWLEVADPDGGEPDLIGESDPEDEAQMRLALKRVVEELDEEEILLIHQRYFDGITDEEIAASLGISLAAARARILRARLRMRSIVIDHLHPPGQPFKGGIGGVVFGSSFSFGGTAVPLRLATSG